MVYASELRAAGGNVPATFIDTHDPGTLTGVQLLVDRTAARDDHGVRTLREALGALEEGRELIDLLFLLFSAIFPAIFLFLHLCELFLSFFCPDGEPHIFQQELFHSGHHLFVQHLGGRHDCDVLLLFS